ncbi:Alpha-pyrone synthesis polyketide synthase-like Pks11 [Sporomusa rhizae]|uniref:type III polyketide synthase n=1 Tax=Sporomusa rhizae TaxID=357999 RepID=UPI00352B2792
MENAKIQAIGTALPQYSVSQDMAKEFAFRAFRQSFKDINRLLTIFDNSQINKRYVSMPLGWYGKEHSFAETNQIYEQVGLNLAEKASLAAICEAGIKLNDIDMVIFVSSTGIATPTIDAALIQRLGLPENVKRIPIWGLGCAGGVSGVARAAELAKTIKSKSVLLVALELCSLTFQREDFSKANFVGASIFGDGAAAVLLSVGGDGPEIVDSYSHLFPKSADIMGWDVVNSGLKVRFSKSIPHIITKYLPELIVKACKNWDVDPKKIQHYIVHPGGAKVIQAYKDSLGLTEDVLQYAVETLYNYGNISSASVLFEMKEFMTNTISERRYGVMLALGPGFSAEKVLFKW